MTDFLQDLGARVKALSGDWATYMVLGNVLLYIVGYLTLRFHLTAMGIGTDLAVVDERYWFTGARFIVYLLAAVPSILLLALPVAAVAWGAGKLFGIDVVLKPRRDGALRNCLCRHHDSVRDAAVLLLQQPAAGSAICQRSRPGWWRCCSTTSSCRCISPGW